MTAIDRQQIIEDAAKAEWAAVWPSIPYETSPGAHADFAKGTAAALPVIVAAALKPIRELHAPIAAADYSGGPFRGVTQVCTACGTDDGNWQRHPCPTVRLLDQIEAAAKGGE